MSCIAGCISFAGPVQQEQVRRMLVAMSACAPDGIRMHAEAQCVIGVAHLRTGNSPREAAGPLTLDGKVWLVADARIDGRKDLCRLLRRGGRSLDDDATDEELILHAYALFGDDLVHHVIGDFAFAVWDAPRGRLLCARDHFGVRPFHYERTAEGIYFASRMEGLEVLRDRPRDLDMKAIGEFLLVSNPLDPARTFFKDVRRLPRASLLLADSQRTDTRNWWRLERGPDIRYRRRQEYVEHFLDLFGVAVSDRMPDSGVALHLTGGMDSTSIAAVAVPLARRKGYPAAAYHQTMRSVLPEDREVDFAAEAAAHLGIALSVRDLGLEPLFSGSGDPVVRTAMPIADPHLSSHAQTFQLIADSGARVVLSGYMGDSTVSTHRTYYSNLLRKLDFGGFAREARHHWRGTHSLRGLALRTVFKRSIPAPEWRPDFPAWINSDLRTGCALDEAWNTFWSGHQAAVDGFDHYLLPWNAAQFEASEILRFPMVTRYPYVDTRLLRALSGFPNFMLNRKTVVREAMRDRLPTSITSRPKTGAYGDLARQMIVGGRVAQRPPGITAPGVDYAVFDAAWQLFRQGQGSDSTWQSWLMIHPLALEFWLANNQ